ncbi:TraR/DksA family transcriptional regulator, partial [PVC group bacterium]|nr:TraR/DksA family transcriptional regulator [PVC group bacterium]
MRKSEIEKFKKKLLELKSEIFSGIQSLQSMNLGKNQSGDLSAAPKHMADVGTDNYDREFYLN